jgi:hypothetical protein
MNIEIHDPPRVYKCGHAVKRFIKDCGHVSLEADEQITLTTQSGTEYDICRKDFGYYATPSTNSRLATFGLRTVLTVNHLQKLYVLLVEAGREQQFESYIREERMRVVCWLDSNESVKEILGKMES